MEFVESSWEKGYLELSVFQVQDQIQNEFLLNTVHLPVGQINLCRLGEILSLS